LLILSRGRRGKRKEKKKGKREGRRGRRGRGAFDGGGCLDLADRSRELLGA